MTNVFTKIFFPLFLILNLGVNASTIGIATGNKTVDGRPLLFKNKDRKDNYPSDVSYYNGGTKYFSYVFQMNDGQDHTRARMGINTAGFGIVYSDSENLKGASTGPYGSQLTAIALKTCATIDDFKKLLDDTNGKRRAHNHFAVIDSTGKGAMFEVSGYSYVVIPVVDSIGTMANTAKFHPDRGKPASGSTSPQREDRANYLLTHGPENGLDYKYFTNEIIKDFCETQKDEDRMPVGQYFTNPVLSRYKTAAGAVIKGVLHKDNVSVESAMWLCLSEPSLSIALPFFNSVSDIPSFLHPDAAGDGMAGSSDRVRRLVYNYADGRYSDRYVDTYTLLKIREHTYKIQDSLFNSYEQNLSEWLKQPVDDAVKNMKTWMYSIDYWAKTKYDSIVTILDVKNKNNIPHKNSYKLMQNYPNPFNPVTTIKYFIPAEKNGSAPYSKVILKVYNIFGEEIATLVNKPATQGMHTVVFNAKSLASGIYFYSISVNNFTQVKKMSLIK